jgi:nuclear pore complex protein Nup155
LLIYHAADYHNPRIIAETWDNLINNTHYEVEERRQAWEAVRVQRPQGIDMAPPPQPYEMVSSHIQNIAHRTSPDSLIFPIDALLPIVCGYAVSNDQDSSIGADPCWPVLVFLQLGVSHALIVRVLERLFDTREQPYVGRRRKALVQWVNVATDAWLHDLERRGGAGKAGDAAISSSVPDLLNRCIELIAQMAPANGNAAEATDLQRIRNESARLREMVERLTNRVAQGSVFFR